MAAGDLKTYVGKEVTLDVGGHMVEGRADDTFLQIAQASDDWTDYIGTDGEVSRAGTSDDRATITVLLAQTSSSNDVLGALRVADKLTKKGVVAVFVRDRNGRAVYKADKAWIQKGPDVDFGREIKGRSWILRCAKLERVDGGN